MASNKKGRGGGGHKKARKAAPARSKSKKQPTSRRAKTPPTPPEKTSIDDFNYRLMKALSHELRVEILCVLAERVASPNELAKELDEGLSQVSYHVKVLKDYEFIELVETEPRRGAVEHFYRAVQRTPIPPDTWNNLPQDVRKSVSVSILEAFFDDASAALEAGIFDNDPGSMGWTPLIVDSQGLDEVAKLAHGFQKAVADVQAKASKRLPKTNGEPTSDATSATVFLANFLSARSPKEGKKASAAKLR